MSSIATKIGDFIPEGKAKHLIRSVAFRGLFATSSYESVKIGPTHHKIDAKIAKLIFTKESLGEREINGYLQYYQPKPGHVIVNAGAYHGYFAIYLSHQVGPKGHIICFEPEQNNYNLLQKNIKINNLKNITLIKKGLWHSLANLPIITRGSGSTLIESVTNGQTVTVNSLDNELTSRGITRVNAITMDIEGSEIQALKGCEQTTLNNPDIKFAIASYHKVNGQQTSKSLEPIFKNIGLQTITSFPRHLTTYAQQQPFHRPSE